VKFFVLLFSSHSCFVDSFFKLLLFLYLSIKIKIMLKLASIPPPKMPIRKRPSNFITFDPQQKWQTKIGKTIILISFFVCYLIFFALFLYFNVQWKSAEFKWNVERNESCSATVSMIDFIGDINTAYYCLIVMGTVGLLSIFIFKKTAVSSNIFISITILATVTSFMSIATITIYALSNGWNTSNCTDSKIVDFLNRRLIIQSLASLIVNVLYVIICYHLHKKGLKQNILDGSSRRVYSISPPEFVSSFPPPPPYYSTRQTC
jgi:magnesium-transporting ATPase (P-type)